MADTGVLATGVIGLAVSGTTLAYSTRRRITFGIVGGFVGVVAFSILVAVGL